MKVEVGKSYKVNGEIRKVVEIHKQNDWAYALCNDGYKIDFWFDIVEAV